MRRVSEETLPSGWRAVRLANEAAEVVLLPDKGAEIYELRSLEHDVDVLWKAPWGLRPPAASTGTAAKTETIWLDHYGGGWQELFPNAGDACEYRGAELAFHGEVSLAPWPYEIRHGDELEVCFALRCARSPFRVERVVSLDTDRPILRLRERVTNEGSERMPLMWGHHPAYGPPFLSAECRLDLPARAFEADVQQASPNTWMIPGERSGWPAVARAGGGTVDLSAVPGPEARVANLGYALELDEGWYALRNPGLGLGVGLLWPVDVFSCVWIWQEFRGTLDYPWYGSVYVMGVEPHSSVPGRGLVRALERGTARWLEPRESLEVEVSAILFEERGRVRRISPDGMIEY
jgi:hypothetical protein